MLKILAPDELTGEDAEWLARAMRMIDIAVPEYIAFCDWLNS